MDATKKRFLKAGLKLQARTEPQAAGKAVGSISTFGLGHDFAGFSEASAEEFVWARKNLQILKLSNSAESGILSPNVLARRGWQFVSFYIARKYIAEEDQLGHKINGTGLERCFLANAQSGLRKIVEFVLLLRAVFTA